MVIELTKNEGSSITIALAARFLLIYGGTRRRGQILKYTLLTGNNKIYCQPNWRSKLLKSQRLRCSYERTDERTAGQIIIDSSADAN